MSHIKIHEDLPQGELPQREHEEKPFCVFLSLSSLCGEALLEVDPN
jgi:hypothetical protein